MLRASLYLYRHHLWVLANASTTTGETLFKLAAYIGHPHIVLSWLSSLIGETGQLVGGECNIGPIHDN